MATVTLSDTCEIELTSIISLSQLKLQKNFKAIADTLLRFEDRLDNLHNALREHSLRINQYDRNSIVRQNECTLQLNGQIQQLKEALKKQITNMQEKQQSQMKALENRVGAATKITVAVQEQQKTLQSDIQEYMSTMKSEIEKTNETINLKQEMTETEIDKIRKQISSLAMVSLKKIQTIEDKSELICNKLEDSLLFKDYKQIAQAISPYMSGNGQEIRPLTHLRTPSNPNQRRSSYVGLPGDEAMKELKQALNETKMRMEQFQCESKTSLAKMIEKINLDAAQLKNLKNQIKKEINKDKQESSQSSVIEKIQEIRPELNKIYSRMDAIDDKAQNMDRRIDEVRRNHSDLSIFVRQNSFSKFEEKLKNLQSELFTQVKDLTQRIDTKTNIADFLRMCQLYDDKFKDTNESLATKCEKIQVKKALLFIESKIKEIILVISEDEENEKAALVSKKYIKCISCDKQLDKFSGLVNTEARNWNMMPGKDLQTDSLGKYGITKYGSLAKKLKKLEGSDLPVLRGGSKLLTE